MGEKSTDSKSLVVLTTVPGFMEAADIISKLRAKYDGVTYDVSTTAGMAAAVAARKELRDARIALDKKKPEVKREALDFCAKVEADYKAIRAAVSEYEDVPDAAISAEMERKEAIKEAARLAAAEAQRAIDEKIDRISKLPLQCIGKSSDEIKVLLDQVSAGIISSENYPGDNLARAQTAKNSALEAIQIAYAAKLGEEAEAEAKVERERIEAIQKKIETIRAMGQQCVGWTVEVIESAIADLEKLAIGDAEYKEFRAEAQDAKVNALQSLADTLAEKVEAKRISDEADKKRDDEIRRQQMEISEQKRAQDEEAEKQKAFFADLAEKAKVMQDKIDAEKAELRRMADEMAAKSEAENKRIADEEAARQAEVEAAALAETVAAMQDIPLSIEVAANGPEMVTIPRFEYEQLLKSAEKLEALEETGVDNWSGYDEAMKLLKEWRAEEVQP